MERSILIQPVGRNIAVCLLTLMINVFILQAQEEEQDYFEKYRQSTDISKLSPTAAAFTNYVEHPEINSTGMVSINVPVYSLKEKDLSLDINLNYDPNRLKVDSRATWVGTGWALQAGGMITRQVKGRPDDLAYFRLPDLYISGYAVPSIETPKFNWLDLTNKSVNETYISNFPNVSPAIRFPEYLNNPPEHEDWQKAQGWALEYYSYFQYDLEPDIFSVNIEGKSFKFVFNEQGTPKILGELNDYKIEFTQKNNGNLADADILEITAENSFYPLYWRDIRISSFTITSPKGFKYFFDESGIEYTTTYERSIASVVSHNEMILSEQEIPPHASSWYLTKIVSPHGNEMRFTYAIGEIEEVYPRPLLVGACESGGDCGNDDRDRFKFDPRDHLTDFINRFLDPSATKFYFSRRHSTGSQRTEITQEDMDQRPRYKIGLRHLSRIETDNTRIELLSSSDREDLLTAPKLNQIIVHDLINGKTVKDFRFSYFYTIDEYSSSDIPDHWKKRLFLSSLDEISNFGLKSIGHSFQYNSLELPHRFSKAQDAWGYFNDRDYGSQIPRLYVYPDQTGIDRYRLFPIHSSIDDNEYVLPGANREVNVSSILAGTLQKITFPTGGERSYEFEPNDYWDEKGLINVQGGGLRLKSLVHRDGIDPSNDVNRIYSYKRHDDPSKSSGIAVYPPIFGEETNFYLTKGEWAPDVTMGSFNNSPGWTGPESDQWNLFTKRNSVPFNPLTDINGVSIYYTNVSEVHPSNGRIEYDYYDPQTHLTNLPDRRDANMNGCGYCDFYFNSFYERVNNNQEDIWTLDPAGNQHIRRQNSGIAPYPPLAHEDEEALLSGKLNTKRTYAEGQTNPIRIEELQYGYHESNPESIYGVVRTNYDITTGITFDILWRVERGWSVVSKYKLVTNKGVLVKQVITQDFNPDGSGTPIVSIRNFNYVENHDLIRSREIIGPVETSKTEYRYVFDVTGPGERPSHGVNINEQPFWSWRKANRIALPIQTTNYHHKNDEQPKAVSGQLLLPLPYHRFSTPTKGHFISEVRELELDEPVNNIGNIFIDIEEEELRYDGRFELKAKFHDYDDYGNPLLVETYDGETKSLKWVHNGAYLSEVITEPGASSEQKQVIEHAPLIGVTSITDPNGLSKTYFYDEYNRLYKIVDQDGNTIEEYDYYYIKEKNTQQ
ncbi:MAG: RHS repeat domain-containing protein [Bacteroidota bacterium]